jgi:hypothetical protein
MVCLNGQSFFAVCLCTGVGVEGLLGWVGEGEEEKELWGAASRQCMCRERKGERKREWEQKVL